MRSLILCAVTTLLMTSPVWAAAVDAAPAVLPTRPMHDPWHIRFPSCGEEAAPALPLRSLVFRSIPLEQDDAQALHQAAVEHSDAYLTRAKIHKIASFATLPLFAAELVLGQSLYSSAAGNSIGSSSERTAHIVVGTGIMGLFGVNTITGAWNLFGEGWKEKDGRTLRLVHGLLMMAADVGFVATAQSGPGNGRRGALTFATDEATHRKIAFASIGTGTLGYLVMLLGNR